MRVVIVVLVQRVIVLSQYEGLVFVVVVRHLFVFRRFKQASINNHRQEIKSMIVNML